MKITDYILKEIKALSLQNKVKNALKLCKNLPITHIPIVENGYLKGCFLESDIQTIDDKNKELKEFSYLLQHFYTDENASILTLLKLFADYDCNIIPVLNQQKKYMGYYELSDILDVFANSPFLANESETLLVEKNKTDVSMSEVTQIIEANNATLLGLYISNEKSDTIQISVTIFTNEMNELIQTFRRYDYHVITDHEDDVYLDDLKNRSDYLQKYLNM